MKVEHITFGNTSAIRNTKDIYPKTREFFKPLQVGNVIHKIDNTPFTCKITVDEGISLFDLYINNDLICTNICCFAKEDKEPALLYAKNITSIIDKNRILTTPKEDCFIITILINPIAAGLDLMTAGEIELYIYDAIHQGLIKRNSTPTTVENSTEHNLSGNFQVFKIGEPFPWKKYIGHGEVTISVFNTVSFDVVISFISPSPEEIRLFKKGNLEAGLFNYKNVPFLYFNFYKYSVDASLNINKLSETEIDEWLNAESKKINLFLIDGQTGVLHAQRMITINFMDDIRDILENQTQQTKEETDKLITEATNKYTTDQMQKQAIKKMRINQ